MKYFIDYEEVTKETFFNDLEIAIENQVNENYDEILDECYEEIKIGYMTYNPSEVLKNCDPVAYRCGISDEINYQLGEAQNNFENEYSERIDGLMFETQEEDEEEEIDE